MHARLPAQGELRVHLLPAVRVSDRRHVEVGERENTRSTMEQSC